MTAKQKVKIKLYTPHDDQKRLHASQARFRVATCGRRWGKTLGCVNEIAKAAWEAPGSMNWWVAPVYQQTLIAFRMLNRQLHGAYKGPPSKSELTVTLANDAIIQFKSAEKHENLRGEGLNFLVIDEASKVRREAWEEVLRPTLSDTGGRCIMPSTPFGRNWFYHEFMRGNNPDYPEYESFQFPTASNPYIPSDEIALAKSTLPVDVFRQEYEAEFLEDGAGVFRGIKECAWGGVMEPVPGNEYVVGWDIAKHTDWSVVYVMSMKTKHVMFADRFNQIDYKIQVPRVVSIANKYNGAKILMDSTGVGDPVLEMVKDAGADVEGYNFTNTTKQQLVEHLVTKIEKREITYPNIPVLLNELEIYQYELTRAGNVRYNAPDGYHDDCVMALALATWAAFHHKALEVIWL